MSPYCHQGNQHGGAFPNHQPYDRKADGRSHIVFLAEIINQIDTAYPYDLFRQLAQGRDGGLPYAIKVTVNTGVNGCHGNGKGDYAQQRGSACLQQKVKGNFIGKTVYS